VAPFLKGSPVNTQNGQSGICRLLQPNIFCVRPGSFREGGVFLIDLPKKAKKQQQLDAYRQQKHFGKTNKTQ